MENLNRETRVAITNFSEKKKVISIFTNYENLQGYVNQVKKLTGAMYDTVAKIWFVDATEENLKNAKLFCTHNFTGK